MRTGTDIQLRHEIDLVMSNHDRRIAVIESRIGWRWVVDLAILLFLAAEALR